MTTATYIGTTETPTSDGWHTRYTVDVDLASSLDANRDINGPHAGRLCCIVGLLLHGRSARTYGYGRLVPRSIRATATQHSFASRHGRPRTIRLYRANRPYHPASGVPQTVARLPREREQQQVPRWALDECEVTELTVRYWDGEERLVRGGGGAPMELFVPYRADWGRRVFWFYHAPDGSAFVPGAR